MNITKITRRYNSYFEKNLHKFLIVNYMPVKVCWTNILISVLFLSESKLLSYYILRLFILFLYMCWSEESVYLLVQCMLSPRDSTGSS